MDPWCIMTTSDPASFPRVSGDGPHALRIAGKVGEFPPRERGWTVTAEEAAALKEVSPA